MRLFVTALLVGTGSTSAMKGRLVDAVMEGDLDELSRVLEAGIDVNTNLPIERAGPFSALTIAIAQGNLRMVPVLLAAGAAPTDSALLAACGGISMHRDFFSLKGGQHELPDAKVVMQLLSAGADPNPMPVMDDSGGP